MTDPQSPPPADVLDERAPATRNTRKLAVGAIALAAGLFAFVAIGGIDDNIIYYWGPSELHAAGEKAYSATIRLGGLVKEGTVEYEPGATALEFEVTDGQQSVKVKANAVPPQMFRENIGVVIEGAMNPAGYFESQRLMVSHDENYRAPGDDGKVDVEKLIKSVEAQEAGAQAAAKP